MIALLLLAVLVVLGGLGLGVYLLVRPDSPDEPDSPGRETTAPPVPGSSTAPPGNPGQGTSSASTAVEGPPPGSDADLKATASDYVDAVNSRDAAAATALTCERKDPGTLYSVTRGREVRLGEVEVIEGTVGSATVTVGGGETALLLEKREDGWCVAI